MRILLISSSYNGLCQRAHIELDNLGHEISVTLALSADDVARAVALFQPKLLICPFLKEKIPEDVFKNHLCIILHPGITGDRGPSSLDWAIMNSETEWGSTALQAAEEMDAGDIWATHNFPMRQASKASLYRREVTQAAIRGMLQTLCRVESCDFTPEPLDYSKPEVRGQLRPMMKQKVRAINWSTDTVETIVRKINAADSAPGVLETFTGEEFYLYGVRGGAGAGGAMMPLAADYVWAREGCIMNSHYKTMGLHGSEYWTYLLPKRVGPGRALELTEIPLPIGMRKAKAIGMIDEILPDDYTEFQQQLRGKAEALASNPDYETLLAQKRKRRALDEATKSLASYRAAELQHMRMNFYGKFYGGSISYHEARYNFVHKVRPKETAAYLAKHLRLDISRFNELRQPLTY